MEYYVSPGGSDENPGTIAQPFQTLARAAEALSPGDTCVLRGGVYRETLKPLRSGEAGSPIVFRSYEGETPLISGCDVVSGWRNEGEAMWSAPLPADLRDGNQLFVDGRAMDEARWPSRGGGLFTPDRATAEAGTPDSLTDSALPGDADSWAGATLWCAGGAKWICWSAPVTGFDPKTHALHFTTDETSRHWYVPCEGSEYVLMGARFALTGPDEWWLDRDTGRVWVVLSDGDASGDTGGDGDGTPLAVIEAKTRTTAIDLSGLAHVHLYGLHFRGAGLRTDEKSRNLRLEDLHGEYVAHSFVRDLSDDAVVIDGENHVLISCDFGYSSGSVVRLGGRHHKLLGNHIHHGDYAGLWRGTLALSGRRHVVALNTVRHSGRDLVSIHGLTESLIEQNDLSYAGWLTHDLGITYGHNTDFGGTIIRRNHVHNCVAKGLADGIYFDHCSHNVVVCENLIWDIPALPIHLNNPGHFNLIAHNTAYRTNSARDEIRSFDHSHRQDLFGCHFLNNVVNAPINLPENAVVAGNRVEPNLRENLPDGNTPPRPRRSPCEDPSASDSVAITGLNSGRGAVAGAVQPGHESWPVGHECGEPIDETIEWVKPDWTYTNRLVNAAFELGTLEGWRETTDGHAMIVAGNGWGNHVSGTEDAPTGTSRYELELQGPCAVEQEVSGLPMNTRFVLSAWVRSASGAKITLEALRPGFDPVRRESSEPEWKRLMLVFDTGGAPGNVVVRIAQNTEEADARARADNVGLIESDGGAYRGIPYR